MNPFLAMLLQGAPQLVAQAIAIYRLAAADPGTPEEDRPKLLALANDLEALTPQILAAPTPPPGSGA